MSITVLNPGLLTTIQDQGRVGYQQFGVPVSGVMDPRSASFANILVGNDVNEAVLECTMLGPQLRFDVGNCFAVCGGDLGATLNGKPINTYQTYQAKAGDLLKFSFPKSGCRAYIAFAGGLDIPLVMGSRSTYMKARLGGLEGRKLEKEDVIPFRAPRAAMKDLNERHMYPEFFPQKNYPIRVVLGPQDDCFTDEGLHTFLSKTYTVTQEFDRMGCRLEGEVIAHKEGGDIISDGISMGAIQVPSSGKPIIMLADRQTTGGYAKIANVITADFRLMAQLKAGDQVHFEAISVREAQDILLAQRSAMQALARKNK